MYHIGLKQVGRNKVVLLLHEFYVIERSFSLKNLLYRIVTRIVMLYDTEYWVVKVQDICR